MAGRMASAGATAASSMPREAHRPYRFGMTLLCFGGLLNWVGLFENYTEPVRYIGVTCVVSGAILLCFAICCWLRPGAHRENAWGQAHQHANPALHAGRDPVHFITLDSASASPHAKPPDYDSVTDKPPSYDDAIKLSPALLWLANEHERHEGELLASGGGQAAPKDAADEEMTVSEVEDAGTTLPPRAPSRTSRASRGSPQGPRGPQTPQQAPCLPQAVPPDLAAVLTCPGQVAASPSFPSSSSAASLATPPGHMPVDLPTLGAPGLVAAARK